MTYLQCISHFEEESGGKVEKKLCRMAGKRFVRSCTLSALSGSQNRTHSVRLEKSLGIVTVET